MKQLSSFMILNIEGGDRISYTYNDLDDKNGEIISTNNKKSFFAVDAELKGHIDAIKNYIKENKLKG